MSKRPTTAPRNPSESKVEHNYHDYSQLTTEDEEEQKISGAAKGASFFANLNFPDQFHYVLSEVESDGQAHIVSWQPHGRCFKVHDQKEFVDKILNHWFRQTQFTSFQRQLNIYGFKRLTCGPDKNAYYHERFLRGRPRLVRQIHRMKIKGKGPRKASLHFTEPNFYSMPFLPPHPSAHRATATGALVRTLSTNPTTATSEAPTSTSTWLNNAGQMMAAAPSGLGSATYAPPSDPSPVTMEGGLLSHTMQAALSTLLGQVSGNASSATSTTTTPSTTSPVPTHPLQSPHVPLEQQILQLHQQLQLQQQLQQQQQVQQVQQQQQQLQQQQALLWWGALGASSPPHTALQVPLNATSHAPVHVPPAIPVAISNPLQIPQNIVWGALGMAPPAMQATAPTTAPMHTVSPALNSTTQVAQPSTALLDSATLAMALLHNSVRRSES